MAPGGVSVTDPLTPVHLKLHVARAWVSGVKDPLVRLDAADVSAQTEGVGTVTICSWGDATINYQIAGVSTAWATSLSEQ